MKYLYLYPFNNRGYELWFIVTKENTFFQTTFELYSDTCLFSVTGEYPTDLS
jgi:hypothetical protein